MKTLNLLFLAFLLVVSMSVFTQNVNYEFQFSLQDFQTTVVDDYLVINSDGDYYLKEEPGKPALPMKSITLSIPIDAEYQSHKIKETIEVFARECTVFPMQPPVPTDGSNTIWVNPDRAVYDGVDVFPNNASDFSGSHILGNYKFITIEYCPFKYYPAENRVDLVTSLELDIFLTQTTETINRESSSMHYSLISSVVENKDEVIAPQSKSPSNPNDVQYLIITGDNLVDEFQELVDWKTQKGVPAEVISMSYIQSNYTGATDQLRIKNCLYDYYQNKGLVWVLLGGDNTIVPDQDCYGIVNPGLNQTEDNTIPTDHFYSCFDYQFDWNADGDDKVGEIEDNVDLAPEIFIGRAPVQTDTEAWNFVNKTINHILNPPLTDFSKKFVSTGLELWNTWGGHSDADWRSENMWNQIIAPAWTGTKYKYYDTNTDFGGDTYDVTNQHTSDILNDGYNIFWMATHGGQTAWSMETGDAFYDSHAASLYNQMEQGLIITMACNTNAFETSKYGNDPCLSEAFLRNGNGGAVLYHGSSRFGWGNGSASLDHGSSMEYARDFFDALFNGDPSSSPQRFGAVSTESKLDNIGNAGWYGSSYRWLMFSINNMGDPEMTIFTEDPSVLSVSHPITAYSGQLNAISVSTGIPDALVCITDSDPVNPVYNYATTNSAGDCMINVTPNEDHDLTVTVTASNCKPSITTMMSVPSTDPYVVVDHIIPNTSDGDANLEAGENATFDVVVINYGGVAANTINLELDKTDPEGFITITDNLETYNQVVNPGDTLTISGAFAIDIAMDVTYNYLLTLLTGISYASKDMTWYPQEFSVYTNLNPYFLEAVQSPYQIDLSWRVPGGGYKGYYDNGGWFNTFLNHRAVLFEMSDFEMSYPVEISRLASLFYEGTPWSGNDQFRFYIIDEATDEVLFISDWKTAPSYGWAYHFFDYPFTLNSDFYVTIETADQVGGYPNSLVTDNVGTENTHSWHGTPGNWTKQGYEFSHHIYVMDAATGITKDLSVNAQGISQQNVATDIIPGNGPKYSFQGYNIYRNGTKINGSPVTDNSYTDFPLAVDVYNYEVTAVYAEGESCASNEVYAAALDENTVFFDQFATSNKWSWDYSPVWDYTNQVSYSASHSLTDSPNGDYPSNMNSRIWTDPPVSFMNENATTASVSFYAKYNIEEDYDTCYFEVTTDLNSGSYEMLGYFTGNDNIWTQYTYDVSDFIGNGQVYFIFRMVTDQYVEEDGIYIDDFKVEVFENGFAPARDFEAYNYDFDVRLEWASPMAGGDGWFSHWRWNTHYSTDSREKGSYLNLAEFGNAYPMNLEKLRHYFYNPGGNTWGDNTRYTYRIYSKNGVDLLWESEQLEAVEFMNEYTLPTPFELTDDVLITVKPVSATGAPYSLLQQDYNNKHRSYLGDAQQGWSSIWGNYATEFYLTTPTTKRSEPTWGTPGLTLGNLVQSKAQDNMIPVPDEDLANAPVFKGNTSLAKNVTGYNIYRNGTQVNGAPVTNLWYTDNIPHQGYYNYNVTAVYAGGESVFSQNYSVFANQVVMMDPPVASADDEVTLWFDPAFSCQAGNGNSLEGYGEVRMHSGIGIGGTIWNNTVDWDNNGANSQTTHFTVTSDGQSYFTYTPQEFYGTTTDQNRQDALCMVFNGGDMATAEFGNAWAKEGKAPDGYGGCMDIFIPLEYRDTLFSDDFENGLNNWIVTGDWAVVDYSFFSETHSLTDSPNGNYSSPSNTTATLANSFSLVQKADALVEFTAIYGLAYNDFVIVEASDDDFTTYIELGVLSNWNWKPWDKVQFSLDAMIGKPNVKIRLRLIANDTDNAEGIFIDDFLIKATEGYFMVTDLIPHDADGDGILEANESATFDVVVLNGGGTALSNIPLTLSAFDNSGYINITDNSATITSLAVSQRDTLFDAFALDIAINTTNPYYFDLITSAVLPVQGTQDFDFNFNAVSNLYPINVAAIDGVGEVELTWDAPGSSKNGAKEVLGYNVYRDNVKINGETPVNAFSYLDELLPVGGYEYYITAVYANGESCSSETVTGYSNDPYLIFFEDYEGYNEDDWNCEWGFSNAVVHSGSVSMANSPNGNYANNQDCWVKSDPPIHMLNVNADSAKLTFWAKFDIEENVDTCFLELSHDFWSGQRDLLGCFTGSNGDWQEYSFDISDYIGSSFVYIFRMVTNDNTNFDGIYIDDVSVYCYDNNYAPPRSLEIANYGSDVHMMWDWPMAGGEGWFSNWRWSNAAYFNSGEKASYIDLAEFGNPYPMMLSKVRHCFYNESSWNGENDFTVRIYEKDGQTMIFESEVLYASDGAYEYTLPQPLELTDDVLVTIKPVNVYPTSNYMEDYNNPGHGYLGNSEDGWMPMNGNWATEVYLTYPTTKGTFTGIWKTAGVELENIVENTSPQGKVNIPESTWESLPAFKGNQKLAKNTLGFNVFRDGMQINNTLVSSSYYYDTVPHQGVFNYTVKAVYAGDEMSVGTKTVPATVDDVVLIYPMDAAPDDELTLWFDPFYSCESGQSNSLEGSTEVRMHSGVGLNGTTWSNSVAWDATGYDGTTTYLSEQPEGQYTITYTPSSYYGVNPNSVEVDHMDIVFNGGNSTANPWDKEGKAPDGFGGCQDIVVPMNFRSVLFEDDFESGLTNWTTTGTWAAADDMFFTATHCLSDSPWNWYQANSETSATLTAGLDFTGYSSLVLEYNVLHVLNNGDHLLVDVSTDDFSTYTILKDYVYYDWTPWLQESVSLDLVANQSNVKIRFRLVSDGSDNDDGVFIDDVKIKGYTSQAVVEAIPYTQDFTVFPTPDWEQFEGQLTASSVLVPYTGTGDYDGWHEDGFNCHNTSGTGAIRGNIWSTNHYYWYNTPFVDLGANTGDVVLRFDMAGSYWNSCAQANLAANDIFAVVISTDGVTWTNANTLIEWVEGDTFPEYGETYEVDLSAYSGQVKFGFYHGHNGSATDLEVFVDNVYVGEDDTPMTIAEARLLPLGTEVTVTGVVTNGDELGNIRYFQDATAGIAAYGASQSSVIFRGDSVTYTGVLKDYNGLLEIDPITNMTVVASGVILPDPLNIEPGDLAEAIESQLITIDTVFFENPVGVFAAGSYSVMGPGSDNAPVYVRYSTNLIGENIPASPVILKGIVSQYSPSNPSAGYQINLRDTDDIVPLPLPPTSPLTAVVQDDVTISWDAPLPGLVIPGMDGFNIYRADDLWASFSSAVMINSSMITDFSYLDENLTNQGYSYWIEAVYSDGYTAVSEKVTAIVDNFLFISGYVTLDDATPVGNVMVKAVRDGGYSGALTNDNGYYTITVTPGIDYTVFCEKTGFTFSPLQLEYPSISASVTDADFTAIPSTVSISGNIADVIGGVAGVQISFSNDGGTVITDADGNYTHEVPYNYSGLAVPSKSDYTFSPASRSYDDLETNVTGDDYAATCTLTYTVSGTISDGTSPLEGVTVTLTGSKETTLTGADGTYSFSVDHGYSGTITPTFANYTFAPVDITLSQVTANSSGNDFVGTPDTYPVSGTVTWNGAPLEGVLLNFEGIANDPTTGIDGTYTCDVPAGWAGYIAPILANFTFTPSYHTVPSVSAPVTGMDFEATHNGFVISGQITEDGSPLVNVTVTATDPLGAVIGTWNTLSDGSYNAVVPYGFTGDLTPEKLNYEFTPQLRSYNNVTADISGEDYTATNVSTHTVSGYVTDGVFSMVGVTITLSGSKETTLTDNTGYYSFTVTNGYSGTLTPSFTGYVFTPESRPLTNITANSTDNNFVGTQGQYAVSGTVTFDGQPLEGVLMDFENITSDPVTASDGTYSCMVPSGWYGDITPALAGYIFTPEFLHLSYVSAPVTGQDFTAAFDGGVPPGWGYINTDVNHTLFIQETAPKIDGIPLSYGSWIGVFYDDNGVEKCAGAIEWQGATTPIIAAQGDDATTPEKDGFAEGETIVYKFFTNDVKGTELYANATYSSGPEIYTTNGSSVVPLLQALTSISHTVQLAEGWSGISSYVIPDNDSTSVIFEPVLSDFVILKSMTMAYWPPYANQLVHWNAYEGYKLKMDAAGSLDFVGSDSEKTLTLGEGWCLLPVLTNQNVDATTFFAPVLNNLIIAKSIDGMGVYWPSVGVQTLTSLVPGESYMAKFSAESTVSYPPLTAKSGPAHRGYPEPVKTDLWAMPANTGVTHTIAFSDKAAEMLNTGDLIGAFDKNDRCVGIAEVVDGQTPVISVYGDDPTTVEKDGMFRDEAFSLSVYNTETGAVEEILVEFDEQFDETYSDNGMSVVVKSTSATGIGTMNLEYTQVFPNPATDKLYIHVPGGENVECNVRLISANGGNVKAKTTFAGRTTIDISVLPSGVYLVAITDGISNPVIKRVIKK